MVPPQHESPQLGLPQLGLPQLGSPQFGLPKFGLPQFGFPNKCKKCKTDWDLEELYGGYGKYNLGDLLLFSGYFHGKDV